MLEDFDVTTVTIPLDLVEDWISGRQTLTINPEWIPIIRCILMDWLRNARQRIALERRLADMTPPIERAKMKPNLTRDEWLALMKFLDKRSYPDA